MKHHTLSAILVASFLSACSHVNSQSETKKIIGNNDMIPVEEGGKNLPETLRPLIYAIGMLELGCTVTHIGNGVALTAGHCVPQQGISSERCLSESFPKMIVRWNYFPGAETVPASNCVKVLQTELNDKRDYAILLVDNPPKAKIDVDLTSRPKISTQLTLLGHPKKRALEWSQYCTLEKLHRDDTADTLQPSPSASSATEDKFSHQCDTDHGNSGSVVIDVSTLKVIGIHHGGIEDWNSATYVASKNIVGGIESAFSRAAAIAARQKSSADNSAASK
ncbi:hypothetical protein EBU99_05615 [bacterium]|nr:hypothetical protein [bacterium]